jgi:type IV pilus biogenesis protein PilP
MRLNKRKISFLAALMSASLAAHSAPQIAQGFAFPPDEMGGAFEELSTKEKKEKERVNLTQSQKDKLQAKTFEKEMLEAEISITMLLKEKAELEKKELEFPQGNQKNNSEEDVIQDTISEVNNDLAEYNQYLRKKSLEAMSYVYVDGINDDLQATIYYNGANILAKKGARLPGGWEVDKVTPYSLVVVHPQSPGMDIEVQLRSPYMTDQKLKQVYGFSPNERGDNAMDEPDDNVVTSGPPPELKAMMQQ